MKPYLKNGSRWAAGLTALFLTLLLWMPVRVQAKNAMPISFNAWHDEKLQSGTFTNTRLIQSNGQMAITLANGQTEGSWTSPSFPLDTPMNKLVSSWQANTPGLSSIETNVQVQTTDGRWSKWYNMGNWSFANQRDATGEISSNRGFAGEQADEIGSVDQDTHWTNDNIWVKAYKLKGVLHASTQNSADKPVVRQIAAVASDYLKNADLGTSRTTMNRTIELPVPALSQYLHNGEYPQFDGGGASWCSPASVSMVLRYYGEGPTRSDILSLPADPVFDANQRRDGDVAYAAHHIFDNGYPEKNTGNWPLNTAYAAHYGLNSSVRQYNSLQDVEQWIKRRIPVVITLKWDNTDTETNNDLTGSSIPKTAGHLMVVRGFTAEGNVIANDPAAPEGNHQVRHIYDRGQLERLWLKAKGGTVYVIRPGKSIYKAF